MRIVLAVHHFPPKYTAGAELRAYRTAKWLSNNGHDVHIVTVESVLDGPEDGVLWEDDVYNGLLVRRLSFDLTKGDDRFTWEYDNPWISDHLHEYLAQNKPDVFHLIGGYILGAGAIKAAQAHEIPVVVTLTDFWFYCPRINLVRPDGSLSNAYEFNSHDCTRCRFEEKRRYRRPAKAFPGLADKYWARAFRPGRPNESGFNDIALKFEQRNRILTECLAEAAALICPSQFLVDTLRSRGLPEGKLHMIQHGLDKTSWIESDGRNVDGVFRIGYLGQIDKHKGVHLLLRAYNELEVNTPLELVVYGDLTAIPNYANSLINIASTNPNIRFLGKYDYSNVAKIFAQLDVLVIPSIWNEIGPWVMYEALDTKTPVIASDIPNMSHIIRHEENGLLFKTGYWQDLAQQLQRLIESESLRSHLIDGITPVNTIENEMADLNSVYQNVVKELSPGGTGQISA
jgi:glycosyltransferase involved in cell wall biosynthesis